MNNESNNVNDQNNTNIQNNEQIENKTIDNNSINTEPVTIQPELQNNNINEQNVETQINQTVTEQSQVNVETQPELQNNNINEQNVETQINQTVTEQSQVNVETQPVNPSTNNISVSSDLGNQKKSNNKIIIIIIVILLIVGAVALFFIFNKPSSSKGSNANNENTEKDDKTILLEDVNFLGHSCFDSKCSYALGTVGSDKEEEYSFDADNNELFKSLSDYLDYIKVNIYYTEKDNVKTIVNYKLILKSTNEELNNINSEEDLREKIGMFSKGNHTESLKLLDVSNEGFGIDENENTYTYVECQFQDTNNNNYLMIYKNPDKSIELVVDNTYSVTFEVIKGTFGYEYDIL